MRRSPAPQDAASVSLFPFLAVLLCTMGALILVLVVIARQAQLQAAAEAHAGKPARDLAADEEQRAALEMVEWRIRQFEAQRAQTEDDLAKRRLELGHLEEHARQLRDQLAELRAALANIDSAKQLDAQQVEQAKADLHRLHDQIAEAQQRVNLARRQAGAGNKSFAVVPYEGPNQTRRRPIYIECRVDGVYLQPENIRLTEDDFLGPMGPGNPLASALRAAREHLAAEQRAGEPPAEPYPLLLVRPSGIVAYYVARQALQSWGSDFGYELVDEDWQLAYHARDPQLEVVERRAIEGARQRLRHLAVAVPRRYGDESRPSFAVPPGDDASWMEGGFAGQGGSQRPAYRGGTGANGGGSGELSDATGGGALPSEQRLPAGARDALLGDGRGGGGAGSLASSVTAESLEAVYGSALGSSGTAREGFARQGDGTGRYSAASGSGRESGSETAETQGEFGSFGTDGSRAGRGGYASGSHGERKLEDGPLFSASGEGTGSAGGNGVPPKPGSQGQPGADASNTAGPSSLTFGDANQRASGGGGMGGPGQMESGTAAQTASGNEGPAGAEKMTGQPSETWSPTPSTRMEKRSKRDLAASRGRNWALPESQRGSVAITRPIRIECQADRLVLLAESNLPAEHREIPISGQTDEAVDELVARVWDRMNAWGIAGRGMHWRPVLQLEVRPDGMERAQDLKDLLANSGLGISETLLPTTPTTARQPATPTRR